MATNDDFDLSSLFQGPGAMLSGVLGVADNARKTVGGVMETIASLQRAAVAVEQLVTRMNRLVDDFEAPLRALTPELEKTVVRMQRMSTALEGPIDRLLPGLEAAVGTFDRVALSQLPETVEDALQQLQALLELFGEIPRRLGQLSGRSGLAALFPLGGLGAPRSTSRVEPVKKAPTSKPSEVAAARVRTHEPGSKAPTATSKKSASKRSVAKASAPKKGVQRTSTPTKAKAASAGRP